LARKGKKKRKSDVHWYRELKDSPEYGDSFKSFIVSFNDDQDNIENLTNQLTEKSNAYNGFEGTSEENLSAHASYEPNNVEKPFFSEKGNFRSFVVPLEDKNVKKQKKHEIIKESSEPDLEPFHRMGKRVPFAALGILILIISPIMNLIHFIIIVGIAIIIITLKMRVIILASQNPQHLPLPLHLKNKIFIPLRENESKPCVAPLNAEVHYLKH